MAELNARIIVDTSVILAFYLPADPGKVQALALLGEHAAGRVEFAAPTLTMYEILSVLARCVRGLKAGQQMTVEQAGAVRAAVERLEIEEISVQPLAGRTMELAVELGCSAYDASYLAMAEDQGVVLVTADERLFNGVRGGFPSIALLRALDPDHIVQGLRAPSAS